jgi:hypothetical protein
MLRKLDVFIGERTSRPTLTNRNLAGFRAISSTPGSHFGSNPFRSHETKEIRP